VYKAEKHCLICFQSLFVSLTFLIAYSKAAWKAIVIQRAPPPFRPFRTWNASGKRLHIRTLLYVSLNTFVLAWLVSRASYTSLNEMYNTSLLRTGRPGDRDSILGQRQRIFPLVSVSSPAVRPTQPPVQCLLGVLSQGKSAAGAWRWPLIPSSVEAENEQELYFLSPQTPSWRVVGQL
jgi:hypothetical protein